MHWNSLPMRWLWWSDGIKRQGYYGERGTNRKWNMSIRGVIEGQVITALMDITFSPIAAWCIGSVKKGRAWGASKREPMVQMIALSMIKYIGPEDREVPTQEERWEYAKKQKEEGEYKKWVI